MTGNKWTPPKGAEEIPTSGDFFKWDAIGQGLTGRLLRMELSRKYQSSDDKKNYVATLVTDDGERIAFSAPLKLRQAIEEFDLIGHRVAIQYVGDTEAAGGTVKEFKVWRLKEVAKPE